MKRIYSDYLNDILEAITDIESFIRNVKYEQFKDDRLRRNAVIRSLEIIGESVKSIPEEIKNRYSEIPWKRMIGMRDKLIHAYFGVDYEAVWAVVTQRLPEIKPVIQRIIAETENHG